MCGRFGLVVTPADLLKALDIVTPVDFSPREEFFPSDLVLCIYNDTSSGKIKAEKVRWGFEAPWDRKKKIINARCESMNEKHMFAEAAAVGRCLIPATCFYEWSKPKKSKYKISIVSGCPFSFGGILQKVVDPVDAVCWNCSIITTDAGKAVSAIHERMPVIVPPDEYRSWLASSPLSQDIARKIFSPDNAPDLMLQREPDSTATGNLFA